MKTWTKEELYKPLEETSVEEFIQLKTKVDACTWRQTFHIQPITGLLNDPNGFSYFNGEYNLFYQWFPLGPVHGLKHWYHVKSKDLVHWENVGLGLKPEYDYENYGVYSGSAIEKDGQLHILYTGNHRDKNWQRKPMQALAKMNKQGIITKLEKPVIDSVPQGYTEHFRDPKVWEENGTYYAVIGAQRENLSGTVVLYSSKDMTDWTFEGEIQTDYTDFGYMWECPDYFELDKKGLLLFSPQGIPAQNGRYQNIYQMGYLLGSPLDMKEKRLEHGEFQELDFGFDFYAAQTTLDEKGRRILIGWMGLPEIDYPTDVSGWAHCLSLPRELRVIDGKLYQTPVEELNDLRRNQEDFAGLVNGIQEITSAKTFEVEGEFTNIQAQSVGLKLRAGNGEELVFKYDVENQQLILDRSKAGVEFAQEFGDTRSISYKKEKLKFRIFVDTSSVEIFINDGEYTMSSRFFSTNTQDKIQVFSENGSANVVLRKWDIHK